MLAFLSALEITEVTEKTIAEEIFIAIKTTTSAAEILTSTNFLNLQEFANSSALTFDCVATAAKNPGSGSATPNSIGKKRLVLLDVDSTLIQEEVIELLANKAGAGTEVARITTAAMSGQIDFATALDARVKLLAGLPETVLEEVRKEITLTTGARELISALQRLGHQVGIVSGGFIDVIEPLAKELLIHFIRANKLEIIDQKLTGRLEGRVIDRAGKAQALRDFAKISDVDITETVAIGDGANDIDMLKIAGIGIAFNAKPILQSVADISLNSPNLDCALYLMGLSEAEIALI
ncbi:unannotated protein [freshwater metagenome]|uniref:phosphoserine phosphatase n=1 Tax=freshwater metagenome TaxID=449393 RepID=A0A6J6GJ04_9ZZZZ|nr:phosphoserine phosphatase SerB [Actinomycetota bacterium]MSY04824.1 phosphoserine phosphatase SerB [Actinomycetota bacterium]MSZ59317.1 phosphoserine phosphatase SerB [Actinomycetota bacterium]MTA01116.1 phosphoserine phosphatase SerB [Actinomycetota bacterium]